MSLSYESQGSWIIWVGPIQWRALLEVGRSWLYTQRRQWEDTAERGLNVFLPSFKNVGNIPLIEKCKECNSRNCKRQENGFSLDLLKELQVLRHIGFSPVKSIADFWPSEFKIINICSPFLLRPFALGPSPAVSDAWIPCWPWFWGCCALYWASPCLSEPQLMD